MMKRLCLAITILLAFAAPCTTAAVSYDCPPATIWQANPPNHAAFLFGVPPQGVQSAPGAAVIQSYGMSFNATELRLNLTLGAPPQSDLTHYYRYWLGFYASPDGKAAQYLDVRIASTTTYATGAFVGSNEMGNPNFANLQAAWNGSTVTFTIPLDTIRTAFQTTHIDLGHLRAEADGPHPSTFAQWFEGGWQDDLDGTSDMFPPPVCTTAPTDASTAAGVMSSPPLGTAAAIAIVAGAVVARRGWQSSNV